MSTIFKNGFEVGNFGFFKDAELTLKLTDDNLFDQIDANGWVDIWFGGADVWIPDFGTYNVFLTCEETFFWDIIDENGKRTKDGFSEMFIVDNPNMESFYGDIIPNEPSEMFDFTRESPAQEDTTLISSNLWFYSNMFKDNYYRYNLLVLNKMYSWPDEIHVKILPMNENVNILEDEYIVGYRPKPEYANQLAVVRNLSSGQDKAIWFKLKVDLEFLSENPNTKRSLKVFVPNSDKLEYLLYPKSAADILWDNHDNIFYSIFQRFLLQYGVSQYMPNEDELVFAEEYYKRMIEVSNLVMRMDSSNLRLASEGIENKWSNPLYKVTGYASLIFEGYTEWFRSNIQVDLPESVKDIIRYTINIHLPFAGFQIIDEYMGGAVGEFHRDVFPDIYDGNTSIVDGSVEIAYGGDVVPLYDPSVNIVKIVSTYGVRHFENGYVPRSAIEYMNPPAGYLYEGTTGNGLYKIRTSSGKVVELFCDMDNGGWMHLVVSYLTNIEQLSAFSNAGDISSSFQTKEEMGIQWMTDTGSDTILIDGFQFKEVIIGLKMDSAKNGSFGELDIRIDGEHFANSSSINEQTSIIIKGEHIGNGNQCQSEEVTLVYSENYTIEQGDWFFSSGDYTHREEVIYDGEELTYVSVLHEGEMSHRASGAGTQRFFSSVSADGTVVSNIENGSGFECNKIKVNSLSQISTIWNSYYIGEILSNIRITFFGYTKGNLNTEELQTRENITIKMKSNQGVSASKKYINKLMIR